MDFEFGIFLQSKLAEEGSCSKRKQATHLPPNTLPTGPGKDSQDQEGNMEPAIGANSPRLSDGLRSYQSSSSSNEHVVRAQKYSFRGLRLRIVFKIPQIAESLSACSVSWRPLYSSMTSPNKCA